MNMNPPQDALHRSLQDFCPPHLRPMVAQLTPVLYADLKRMAQHARNHVRGQQTLNTTALVHEAFVRLFDNNQFVSHGHFLRVAAITMRHLLVDHARAQMTAKRNGGTRLPMEAALEFHVQDDRTVNSVHEALLRLAKTAPRLADIVECRFFGGYGQKETALALDISERTVQRDWALARAWLRRELGEALDGIDA